MIFEGWNVVRAIPYQYLAGLLTREYALSGGVIRHAAGSAQAGQIVAHLLPAASSIGNLVPGLNFIPGIAANIQLRGVSNQLNTIDDLVRVNSHQLNQLSGQMGSLTQATQQVLQLSASTAVLSGLGLAVSCIGFSLMQRKLTVIDDKLDAVKAQIKEIMDFLYLGERAELRSALGDLLKTQDMKNASHRDRILNDRRQQLMKLNEKYKELLAGSTTIACFAANEEYFALTALAYARCSAELGMLDIASQEMQSLDAFWKEQSRRAARDLLIGTHPERFLASDFAQFLPVSSVVSWLDFANDEVKGYEWIDTLLRSIDEPWYNRGFKNVWGVAAGSGLNRSTGRGLDDEQRIVVPTLQKLLNRNSIFDGYVVVSQ